MFINLYNLHFQHMLLIPYLINKYHCQVVNMLDHVVYFSDDCDDIRLLCLTASGLRVTSGKCLNSSGST